MIRSGAKVTIITIKKYVTIDKIVVGLLIFLMWAFTIVLFLVFYLTSITIQVTVS